MLLEQREQDAANVGVTDSANDVQLGQRRGGDDRLAAGTGLASGGGQNEEMSLLADDGIDIGLALEAVAASGIEGTHKTGLHAETATVAEEVLGITDTSNLLIVWS